MLLNSKQENRRGSPLAPEVVQAAREFVFDLGYSASRSLDIALGHERFMGQSGRDKYSLLLQYFPDAYAARLSFTKLVADCRETFSSDKEDDGVPGLDSPLTDEETHRMRFAHSWNTWSDFERLGPRWGRGLSLYLHLCPGPVGAWLRSLLSHLGLFQSRSSSGTARGLKLLSDCMKKQGALLSPHWRYAVNLETLGGYRSPLPINSFIPELRAWATGNIVHTYPTPSGPSEQAFLAHFRAGVRSFLQLSPSVARANQRALTLDQFVSDPSNWANSGSTHFSGRVQINTRNGVESLERNKATTSLLLHPSFIKRLILSPHNQRLRPIEKLETGKVRAVVNADDTTYLKMAYVSNWLELAMAGHPESTLFMTLKQRAEMWQRLALATRNNVTKIPLDQSHFDWQPNKSMLAVVIEEIRDFIRDNALVDVANLVAVTDSIFQTLVVSPGAIEVRGQSVHEIIPVEKGVMSGWRWTALIDTLCNAGELAAAKDLCHDWGFPDAVISFVAQGDDDQVHSPTFAHATALATAYSSMNFEINPGKFFIDTRRDEFLRLVPLPDRVVGYPSRAINNILWRNPINPDPLPGESTIRAQLSQWLLLINRGLDEDKCIRLMLHDMTKRNKVSREDLVNFLLTPAPYGGCGLVGTKLTRTAFVRISQQEIKREFSVVSELPGLAHVAQRARELNIPEKVVSRSARSRLPLGRLRGEVTPLEVAPVSVGIAKAVPPTQVSVPQSYRMSNAVPRFLADEYTRQLVEDGDIPRLRQLCDPDLIAYFDRFKSIMSKSCFKLWLLGKLDLAAPVVLGFSPEQIAAAWAPIASAVLLSGSTHWKLTNNYLRAAATASVLSLQAVLDQVVPVSG